VSEDHQKTALATLPAEQMAFSVETRKSLSPGEMERTLRWLMAEHRQRSSIVTLVVVWMGTLIVFQAP
jgi:hypothetical protein